MERIPCQNIAEYIFYLVHGRDIRHIGMDEALAEVSPAKENPAP
jgi:hypothetical protein